MIIFKYENFSEHYGTRTMKVLLDEYEAEAKIDEVPSWNVNIPLLKTLEKGKVCHSIFVYDNQELIGFATLIICPLLKYSEYCCIVEAIFISKKNRKSGTGINLIKEIEKKAKQEGVIVLFLSAPTNGSLDKIAERNGFKKTNITYSKALI